MIPRSLAAVLSSLISQLSLLVLLLLHPSPIVPHSLLEPNLTSLDSHQSLILSSLLIFHQFLSSSDIATALRLITTTPHRKRKRNPENHPPLPIKTPDFTFRLHFNMSPSTFDWLFDLLEPLLDYTHPEIHNLPNPKSRLTIALDRLTTGSSYHEIARRFHITELAAKFCTKQLCRILCNNFRFWVGFPSHSELESVSNGFNNLTGLPNCCGVITSVRFNIKSDVDDEQTVAVQLVVDSNSRILSIVAGFSGEKSDYEILKLSSLYKDINSGELLQSGTDDVVVPRYLVGVGGGYPLLPWLMVPFVDPSESSEEVRFNSAVSRLRIPVLRTVESLKKWGVLRGGVVMESEVRNAVACIGACAILHNALLMREDYSALCGEMEVDSETVKGYEVYAKEEEEDEKGGLIRQALMEMVKESC